MTKITKDYIRQLIKEELLVEKYNNKQSVLP